MDINKIKYYPEKFCIRFDGEDVHNIIKIEDDGKFSLELSCFLHEYYHYLTNTTTFQGIRAFNVSFQDKIRIITIIQNQCGLDGFPLFDNGFSSCSDLINYWKDIDKIITGDSALREICIEIENSPSKSVNIKNIEITNVALPVEIEEHLINGEREMVKFEVEGIAKNIFYLPIAAIDEFLSSSIDELLFETGTVDNLQVLQSRPLYPYKFFDKILQFFNLSRFDTKYKILIAYKALHGPNPSKNLIQIIENISKNQTLFCQNPIDFLDKICVTRECDLLNSVLAYLFKLIIECNQQKRYNLAKVSDIIYEKGILAQELLRNDPYYFVRPFIELDFYNASGREKYIEFIKDLMSKFDGFLQLRKKELVGAFTNPQKNLLAMMLAIYEILKESESSKIIERKVTDYELDGAPGYDKLCNLPEIMPLTTVWYNALNELSFYVLYLDYRKRHNLC